MMGSSIPKRSQRIVFIHRAPVEGSPTVAQKVDSFNPSRWSLMPYRKFKANAGLAWQPMLTSNGIKLNRVGRAMVDSELFEKGLETRRQVLWTQTLQVPMSS
jgi:hypothetical protein